MFKTSLNKIIKNNLYPIILISIIFFTILITNFYSIHKKDNQDQLANFLDNFYLKKSINLIIKNLNSKFNFIDYKIKKGDTFEKIIDQLNLPLKEKKTCY